jgi:hypothetical protein
MTVPADGSQGKPTSNWPWVLVIAVQGALYAIELVVLPFVLFSAYGGDPVTLAGTPHAAKAMVVQFGLLAAIAAGVIGASAFAGRKRSLGYVELALAALILIATGIQSGRIISQ